jgi:glutathione peroxidase
MASVYDIPVHTLAGAASSLEEFRGKVVLVVNVASKCGLTPQYEGLEKLYKQYKDRGFVIAGFPSNDFAGQEPGTAAEIESFCTLNYGVDFPLFEKIPVVGPEKHPLYAALIEARPGATATGDHPFADDLRKYGINPNPAPEVLWNFEKFLVNREGQIVGRYRSKVKPDDPEVVGAIENALG